jgi:hypothetical protein
LGVRLRGQQVGGLAVGADPRAPSLAVLVVTEIPDLAAEIGLDADDAETDALAGACGL